MKTLALFSLIMLSVSSAFAVRTAECPKSISITASRFNITRTLADLKKQLNDSGDYDNEEFAPIASAYSMLKNSPTITVAYDLSSAKNGRCEYSTKDQHEDRITLWTEGGEDRVFAQKTIAPRGVMVRLYAKVKLYSKNALQLADSASVTLAIPRTPYTSYSAGGPLVSIGWANQLTSSVR